MKYYCDDGNAQIVIEAASPEEAAQEYVDGGSWGPINRTIWIEVRVWGLDEEPDEARRIKITLHPQPPKGCDEWVSVGTPRGHGGGVIYHEECRTGTRVVTRITNTWDHDPTDGEQGLTSIRYVVDFDDDFEYDDYEM